MASSGCCAGAEQVYDTHMGLLTKHGTLEACLAAFEAGAACSGAWAAAGRGDVLHDEMAVLAERVQSLKRAEQGNAIHD